MNRSSGHQDGLYASWLLAIKVVETSCPKHTMVYWQTIFMDVVKNTWHLKSNAIYTVYALIIQILSIEMYEVFRTRNITNKAKWHA